jgi:hypothetical protein
MAPTGPNATAAKITGKSAIEVCVVAVRRMFARSDKAATTESATIGSAWEIPCLTRRIAPKLVAVRAKMAT